MWRKRKGEEEIPRDSVGNKLGCSNFGLSGNPSEGGDVVGVVRSGGELECWCGGDETDCDCVPAFVSDSSVAACFPK